MKFKPDMYKKSIYDINYDKLKEMGKKYLFFDLDNTIISYQEKVPNEDSLKLFDYLKKKGFVCYL